MLQVVRGRAGRRPPNKVLSRLFSSSRFHRQQQPLNANESDTLSSTQETAEVKDITALLKAIRDGADPIHRSLIPMRAPMLWKETLAMQAAARTSMTEPDLSRSNVNAAGQTGPGPARRMQDSYCQVDLPFVSNPLLLEKYTNASGGIRTGKLMEHLDSLAGSIAYKHVLGPTESVDKDLPSKGFYLVTAAVDRLDMLRPLTPHNVKDIRLSGHVIYVGRSSMEVAVKMETLDAQGNEEIIMLGRFSMVCRDAITHKARPVNPLIISTEDERAIEAMGEVHKARKQNRCLSALNRVPPSSAEAQAIHNMFLKSGDGAPTDPDGVNRVWIEDTKLESVMMMYPQDRNIHSKIFGGYLMRLAYELGYANASLFCRSQLRFLSLDGISFKLPVPIGSALRLTSHITHTTSDDQFSALVHVWVRANVIDGQTGEERTTNDFYYTWCKDAGEPLERMVVPRTYEEAMQWLEGRRALNIGAEIRGLRGGSTKP